MSQDTLNLFGALITLAVMLWNPIKEVANTLASRAYDRSPDNTHHILKDVVTQAVQAVEQLSHVALDAGGIAPADRKAKATTAAQDILTHFGLKVPDSVVGTYIENAVAQLADTGFSGNFEYSASPDVAELMKDTTPAPAANASPPAAALMATTNGSTAAV